MLTDIVVAGTTSYTGLPAAVLREQMASPVGPPVTEPPNVPEKPPVEAPTQPHEPPAAPDNPPWDTPTQPPVKEPPPDDPKQDPPARRLAPSWPVQILPITNEQTFSFSKKIRRRACDRNALHSHPPQLQHLTYRN